MKSVVWETKPAAGERKYQARVLPNLGGPAMGSVPNESTVWPGATEFADCSRLEWAKNWKRVQVYLKQISSKRHPKREMVYQSRFLWPDLKRMKRLIWVRIHPDLTFNLSFKAHQALDRDSAHRTVAT